jgi:hypothetical protein
MPVTIENLSTRPVLLRCNSNETLHIAPKSVSSEIPDVEIIDNPKAAKLESLGIIAINRLKADESSKATKSEAKRKK